jgi:endogenous inhibitor of DNA gyrase (YacG/DUF329 family)
MNASRPQQIRTCPICGKPQVTEFRPFCSKRCSDVDLYRWLSGSYSIPAVEAEADEAGDEGSLPRPN